MVEMSPQQKISEVLVAQTIHRSQLRNASEEREERIRHILSGQSECLPGSEKGPVQLPEGLFFNPTTNKLEMEVQSYHPELETEMCDMSWDQDLWFQHGLEISKALASRVR